jgi:hypothetical protein
MAGLLGAVVLLAVLVAGVWVIAVATPVRARSALEARGSIMDLSPVQSPGPDSPAPPSPYPRLWQHAGSKGEAAQVRFPAPSLLSRQPLSRQGGGALIEEDFEGAFPGTTWALRDDSDDGFERTWGKDGTYVYTGNGAAWVAAGGADGLDPPGSQYPEHLDSWMVAGPFSLTEGMHIDLEFYAWYDTDQFDDYLFVGVSTDGEHFEGWTWWGWSGGWAYYSLDLSDYAGEPQVWLAFQFYSDGLSAGSHEGVWVDDVVLWESEPVREQELVQNGGFESGSLFPWDNEGSATAVRSEKAYEGAHAARLGGANDARDRLYQQVHVPDWAQIAEIRFWVYTHGEESFSGSDVTCGAVYLALPGDPLAEEGVVDLGCIDGVYQTSGWEEVRQALSGSELGAIHGQDVYLYFHHEADYSLPTEVWLDDVSFRVSGGSGDAYEPDNTPAQAAALTSGAGVFDLTINPAGDEDWFSIPGEAGKVLVADVDAAVHGSDVDSVMWLMDSDLEVLAHNDDDGHSVDSYITHTLSADGTYYLLVSSHHGHGHWKHTYALTATVLTGSPPPLPPPPPPPPLPPDAKEWTAILYLSGDDGDLYDIYRGPRGTLRNLEAIVGAKTSLLDVIVLLDGPNHDDTERFVVQPGGAYTDNVNRWDMGELNMGDPQTLVEFARWAMDNYPAHHYLLAIDDHGDGTRGISEDLTSHHDRITVKELRGALKAITGEGATKIDVLVYEACLMGLYENAHDVWEYADYLFVFESIGWASSWTYATYLAGLDPGMTAEQLGRRIEEQYASLVSHPYVSALVELSEVEWIHGAVDSLADALSARVETDRAALARARDAAQKFEQNGNHEIDNGDPYVDLWHLADRVAEEFPDLTSETDVVKSAVEAAVVSGTTRSGYYETSYWDHSHAHGLSIYWPQTASGSYSAYVEDQLYTATRFGRWDEFLEAYFGEDRRGLPVDPGLVAKPPALLNTIFLPLVLK